MDYVSVIPPGGGSHRGLLLATLLDAVPLLVIEARLVLAVHRYQLGLAALRHAAAVAVMDAILAAQAKPGGGGGGGGG